MKLPLLCTFQYTAAQTWVSGRHLMCRVHREPTNTNTLHLARRTEHVARTRDSQRCTCPLCRETPALFLKHVLFLFFQGPLT
uniref:Uncharacterized protein n=1 Tax=Anguilla anguilla TaxID=7936 RepID=A0A0E9QG57_ANGAN